MIHEQRAGMQAAGANLTQTIFRVYTEKSI